MFGFFRKVAALTEEIVYIRFWRNKIIFYYHPSGVKYKDEPILAIKKRGKKEIITAVGEEINALAPEDTSIIRTPFQPFMTEPENFDLGAKVIRHLMQKGKNSKMALVAPRVIIHPDKTYISEMEEQAYRELALSAGAREAVVYVGQALHPDEIEGVMNAK